jgi:hypothetical protein
VIRFTNIVFLLLFLMSFEVGAQMVADSSKVVSTVLKNQKQIQNVGNQLIIEHDSLKLKPFKPNPMKVVWMGAIIPGYGQIMNKKYWKLPIVYGSFLGCAYALAWNGSKYQSYMVAYKDITDSDPSTNSFLDIIPKGYTIDSQAIGGTTTFTNTLKRKQDLFRRYRDLSIIVTIGVYALSLVDAYVDAQLYDFDISPDLTLRFQPTLIENSYSGHKTLGMQCTLNLK